jgi:hypothetical protein
MHLTPVNGIGSLRSTRGIAAQVILNVGRKYKLEVLAAQWVKANGLGRGEG